MNAVLQALRDKADLNDDGKIDKADLDLAISFGQKVADQTNQKATPLGAMFLVSVSAFVLGALAHKYYVAVAAWWAAF